MQEFDFSHVHCDTPASVAYKKPAAKRSAWPTACQQCTTASDQSDDEVNHCHTDRYPPVFYLAFYVHRKASILQNMSYRLLL